MNPPVLALLAPALSYFDYGGIAVFALSGAVAAAEKKMTLVTFFFFAVVTGMGGGTVRDLLIGAPVFWVHENSLILICLLAGLIVWFSPARLWTGRTLLWLDAIGLGAYATFGAAKSLAFGIAPLPAAAMGVLTACVGGIIRDVLAGEESILIRPELYVTAAALSAGLMVLLLVFAGLPGLLAGLIAGVAGFALRGLAIWKGLALPAYRG